MDKLDELKAIAMRFESHDVKPMPVYPGDILDISEAFRELERRAEEAEAKQCQDPECHADFMPVYKEMVARGTRADAAEAQIADLAKQKPVGTVSIVMDWNTHRYVATVNMRPDLVVSEMKDGDELFTRASPAMPENSGQSIFALTNNQTGELEQLSGDDVYFTIENAQREIERRKRDYDEDCYRITEFTSRQPIK